MKTLQKTILALSFAFTTTYTFAQTAYEKAMMPKVQTIEMPKPNPDDYTAQANDFARIGDKEKTLWQPYYYAAFSILKKGRTLMQQNQIAQLDEVAKEAQNYIDKAEALSPNNAEIYILKKMNHGLKMMVNPMERWQTEGQAAQNALNEAKKLDPENPRITIMEAEDLYFTPEQFGGSKTKGIELGGLLASNGHLAEATAVLQRNLGLDDNGNVKMFDSLRDTQIDLTKVIVMELEELVEKFRIKY
jgi:tetratricopeptide (TPR) repeat protein